MAIEKVREYFRQFGIEDRILEFDVSSATVDLAAKAVGVEGARICKRTEKPAASSFRLQEIPR